MRRAGQSQQARTRVGPRRPQMTSLGYGVYRARRRGCPRGSHQRPAPCRCGPPRWRRRPAGSARTPDLASRRAPDLPSRGPSSRAICSPTSSLRGRAHSPCGRALHSVGLIGRWIPEWAAVDSRPQRSPVHRHTVDRHLLECVVEAGTMVRDVAQPDLPPRGAAPRHRQGRRRARPQPRRRRPDDRDPRPDGCVQRRRGDRDRLVREHLTLIGLATRRDLADPATVAAAWSAAGDDSETLDLFCLTVADAKAGGPAAWTDWRAVCSPPS